MEIKENIELVSNYLSIKSENLIKPQQVHGDNIEFVDDKKEYLSCNEYTLEESRLLDEILDL